MAYFARNDAIRAERARREVMRRLTTNRPRRAHVPSPTWTMEGQITMERYFPPALVTIDPVSDDAYPEHKQVVAVDGWLSVAGPVTISWRHNTGYFYENHEIEGGSNRVVLPEPFLIENGELYGGEFLQPEIIAVPAFACFHLSCIAIIETVPI